MQCNVRLMGPSLMYWKQQAAVMLASLGSQAQRASLDAYELPECQLQKHVAAEQLTTHAEPSLDLASITQEAAQIVARHMDQLTTSLQTAERTGSDAGRKAGMTSNAGRLQRVGKLR
uniref:Uncharacterized protein n=1 Tax=Chlamydomonas leiostraca TaxID=1034604 RepID=A0A7S0RCP3_9CHLO